MCFTFDETLKRNIMKNIATENDISTIIKMLTGLTPVIIDTEDRYLVSLGIMNPLEVGYNKNRKILPESVMRRSALLTMLKTLCEMMEDEGSFIQWIAETSSRDRFFCIQSN